MNESRTTVCTVILSYFGAERVERCVQALAGQCIDTVYLIDNSADPIQAEALREVAERLVANGVEFSVRVTLNTENLGFGRAINRAIEAAEGAGGYDAYLLLNDDAMMPPNGVSDLVHVLGSRSNIGLVSGRVRTADNETRFLWYQRWLGHLRRDPMVGAFPYLPGACLLVDRRLIIEESVFEEAFFMYGEDVALTWKAMQLGLTIESADSVEISHEGSASSKHGTFFYEHHVARGHILLASRLARHPWEVPVLHLGRLAYLPARALVRSFRYRSLAPLAALVSAWFPIRVRPSRRR